MSNSVRCVNLDWLEVHCFEPISQPHDADYFRKLGFWVQEREYGTRVYAQMFTLMDQQGMPCIEVRRDPKSKGAIGIHQDNECHIRLVNRYCYFDNAADIMQEFLARYNYTFNRISRIDICLDFEFFDSKDNPNSFLQRYVKGRYSKINQSNIHSHGADRWDGREWNSISWGSPTSDIGTKMYNKTMELYNPKDNTYGKPYIRYAWYQCGLIDDFTTCHKISTDGTAYVPQIWRVEFSIRSSVRKWFKIEVNGNEKKYQSIHNTLDMYNSREKLLTMFAALSSHYFHFKYYEPNVLKYQCKDKMLFNFGGQQATYKVEKAGSLLGDGKQVIAQNKLLQMLIDYRESHTERSVKEAATILINLIEEENISSDLANPYSKYDLYAMQKALRAKMEGASEDFVFLVNEIRHWLKLNENALPYM